MILQVYSVYDKAVNAFMQPFYARSAGEAIRSFTELANDGATNVSRYPLDYVLFRLGDFDDNSGLFTSGEPARLVGASEVKRELAVPTMNDDVPLRKRGNGEGGGR